MVCPPLPFRLLFPGTTWRVKDDNNVYITFDDGPIPNITPWVLDEADRWNVKLTFFCVGENVYKHPDIYNEILNRGHRVGNHTYNHMKAFSNKRRDYFINIEKASNLIKTNLFRPPHGQLYPWYIPKLKKDFSKIVMWDVLSKDYDRSLSATDVFNNIRNNVRSGSVIVFHDSIKAEKNMKYAFPKTMELLTKSGYYSEIIK